MRIRSKTVTIALWVVPLFGALIYVLVRLRSFANIFFVHPGIAITQAEVAAAFHNTTNGPGARVQHMPKITHQVFHNWRDPGNDVLPDDWAKVRQTCLDRNPGWDHKLWTEKSSREFIATEYPWFLRTYDGYRHKVQRVDAVRYFLLLHYGGIYLDLDNGCKENLEPLLYYPIWVTDPGRGALSNNILAARPHHPFWNLLTQSLIPYDYSYFFPYATISYASGQWFVSDIWQKYHAMLPDPDTVPQDPRLYLLMMDDRPEGDEIVFFTQERGGTWKNWDNRMFLWIGDHLFFFFLLLLCPVGFVGWVTLRYVRRPSLRARTGYTRLDEQGARHGMVSA